MNRPGRVRSCSFNHLLTTKMSNVEFIRTDFNEMLETTPFKPLLSEIKTSSWSVVQLSDIVRLILLKKDGGFYLDFDNIVFRPISCLRNTFSYLEEVPNIENGIMVSKISFLSIFSLFATYKVLALVFLLGDVIMLSGKVVGLVGPQAKRFHNLKKNVFF